MNFYSVLVVATGAVCALAPVSAQAVPPPNDNFANATVLTGQTVSSSPVTIDEATRETLEPANTDNKTVWYVWSPSQDGTATFTDAGTTYYSHVAVFNGNDLTSIVLITESDGSPASVTFPVKAGLVYYVSIGATDSDATGTAVLNIINKAPTITGANVIAVPAGTNDNFANAAPLNTAPLSAFTYPLEATRETLEPQYTDLQTVWWLWTAPADAEVTMEAPSTFDDTNVVLYVFNGDSLADLTVVAASNGGDPTVSFPTKAGASYRVCVGGNSDAHGDFNPSEEVTSILNITTAPLTITSPVIVESTADANDNFAQAQDLGKNLIVTGFGFNANATTETLEPQGDGNSTLWWTWTAPKDGVLTMSATGTDFNHSLTAYTGGSLTTLQSVAGGQGSPRSPYLTTFNVSGGTVYRFVVGGGTGTAVLNLSFTPGLAHVSIQSDPQIVDFSQSHNATFLLSYTGSISTRVAVNYKAKYSEGSYSGAFTGTKKIKPNKSTAKLAIPFSYLESSEAKVKVFLQPGVGYVLDGPGKAKVKIYDK